MVSQREIACPSSNCASVAPQFDCVLARAVCNILRELKNQHQRLKLTMTAAAADASQPPQLLPELQRKIAEAGYTIDFNDRIGVGGYGSAFGATRRVETNGHIFVANCAAKIMRISLDWDAQQNLHADEETNGESCVSYWQCVTSALYSQLFSTCIIRTLSPRTTFFEKWHLT